MSENPILQEGKFFEKSGISQRERDLSTRSSGISGPNQNSIGSFVLCVVSVVWSNELG